MIAEPKSHACSSVGGHSAAVGASGACDVAHMAAPVAAHDDSGRCEHALQRLQVGRQTADE